MAFGRLTIDQILCPVDFSELSTLALGRAVRLGCWFQARVTALHVVPRILGGGARLFDNFDGGPTGFECVELVSSPAVAHYRFVRTG